MGAQLPNVAWARLATGLVQGLALLALYEAAEQKIWPATSGLVFAPLVAVAIFVPTIVISGLGNLRPRVLIAWAAIAVVICVGLAAYDIVQAPVTMVGTSATARIVPAAPTWLSLAAILFIAHTITVSGDIDRKLVANYSTHFDVSWKHGVQLALACCFVGALWGLLLLGAELFRLIQIEFFATLIRKPTFFIPVTAVAFSCALHITDARANIVQGARTLLLILLSWLLPLMVLIGAGFVIALPFTGLEPLWRTRHAASILLIAAATLVFLINAVHRDGRDYSAKVLRYAKVAASIVLLPLTGLAAYAIYLRIDQYGWTPDRIIALACVVVAALYTVGYVFGVARTGVAMRPLESTNFFTAVAIVGILLALHSPILDPTRISVASQVDRLTSGKVSAEQFDYGFLRFRAGRFGTAALEQLSKRTEGPQASVISQRATQALQAQYPYQTAKGVMTATEATRTANITVIQPAGAALPDGFLQKDWRGHRTQYLLPPCLLANGKCEAILVDLDGDGTAEIVLIAVPAGTIGVFRMGPDHIWDFAGALANAYCPGVQEALRAGRYELAEHSYKDILVAGQRLHVTTGCAPKPPVNQSGGDGPKPQP